MPQMAPLWWEALFIMFIMTLLIMSMIIYHNPNISSGESDVSKAIPFNSNWSW